jgi:pyruvate/2-oxoglutarate/acetoin dehydrogenase E1 component
MKSRCYAETIRRTLDELAAHPRMLFLQAGDGAGAPMPSSIHADRDPGRSPRTPLQFQVEGATGLAAAAIGLALTGWRPLATLTPPWAARAALERLRSELAGASATALSHAPIVLRVPLDGSTPTLGQFAGLGGFRVAAPATAPDAADLLRDAAARGVPALYLEDRRLYPRADARLLATRPEGAVVRRPGRDVTLVAFSAMTAAALRAAEMLAERGIEAEVLDPRTLAPFDLESVVRSVWRTHRALIVDEGETPLGPMLATAVSSAAFDELDAPVEVVRVPAGAASLADAIARGAGAIVGQVRWILGETAAR